jgi:hypothetical protein
MIVVALLAILTTMTASSLSILRRTDLRAATGHIRDILMTANMQAQSKGAYRGVKFSMVGDEWFYSIYEDGNGNGILTDDINRGIDLKVDGPRRLFGPGTMANIGFPPSGITDPDTGQRIPEGADAVRFGQSNICSFSEFGTCTPGTIYLTDRVSTGAMVRCSGAGDQFRVEYFGLTGNNWSY